MDIMKLSIVAPSGEIFNNNAKSIVLPGKDGEFGVLPKHVSLVSFLTVGVIEIEKEDSSKELVAINWGYVKISEEMVDILVDSAISLNADKNSDIAVNIEKAQKLVNSVENSNISLASVNAKINSIL
ncbi:ATP synthase epsilon chain [hydrothermal vent metagenome]|uniref:ATP synthase epsilon chain n=1 Tax=hydrothermal vent metagenome TaxID=652676 RepID=A0A3B1E904_9ZZZZ